MAKAPDAGNSVRYDIKHLRREPRRLTTTLANEHITPHCNENKNAEENWGATQKYNSCNSVRYDIKHLRQEPRRLAANLANEHITPHCNENKTPKKTGEPRKNTTATNRHISTAHAEKGTNQKIWEYEESELATADAEESTKQLI